MSLNGTREARLARERKERLRLEHVRKRARALLATCENEIRSVRVPAVQQLAAKDLKHVQKELAGHAPEIDRNPDKALKAISSTQKRLHRAVADAQGEVHRWNRQQAQANARLAEARLQAEAARVSGNQAGDEALARVDRKLATARMLQDQGKYAEALAACDQADTLTTQASEAAFDETVRREVTHGILSTLQEMGFTVADPQLDSSQAEGGVVTMIGRLPSGKQARFDVHLDGHLRFDLDGYEGRTCGKDLERIEQTLKKQFGLKLGPAQITWKDPDRRSKGARDLPTGGTHRQAGR